MINLLFITLVANGFTNGFEAIRTFEIPENMELLEPYDMCFNDAGHLVLLDRAAKKVRIWDENGKHIRSFGQAGQGPGEFNNPYKLIVQDGKIWVQDHRDKKFIVFTEDGTYQRDVPFYWQVSAFSVLPDEKLFVSDLRLKDGRIKGGLTFSLFNRDGDEIFTHKEDTKLWIDSKQVAYGPNPDIQKYKDTWVYGFGSNPVLHFMDANGKTIGSKTFKLKTRLPNDQEIQKAKELNFYIGASVIPYDSDDVTYTHPKGYFTHFILKDDKVLFVSMLLGGIIGAGNGLHEGTYRICDLNSGEQLQSGSFNFQDYATVLFRNGRILVANEDEDSDYQIIEAKIKGF